MHVRVVEAPKSVITLERAKAHCKAEGDEEDDLIQGYIDAANAWIDGPNGWLGQCVGEQTLELVDSAFPSERLPYPPAISIESVHYHDGRVENLLAPDQYRLLSSGVLAPSISTAWPSVARDEQAIRVRYKAGYPNRTVPGESGAEGVVVSGAPAPIQQAILLMVGQWFNTRSAVNVGNIVNEMPFGVDALLAPYRSWR